MRASSSSYTNGLPFEALFAARHALFGPILVARARPGRAPRARPKEGGAARSRATCSWLGNERLSNTGSRPPVRAVDRRNLLGVQLRGDLLQGHPLPEHRVDSHAPSIV